MSHMEVLKSAPNGPSAKAIFGVTLAEDRASTSFEIQLRANV